MTQKIEIIKNFTTQTEEKELISVHFNKLQHFRQCSGKKKKNLSTMPQISKKLRYEKNNHVALFLSRVFSYEHIKSCLR